MLSNDFIPADKVDPQFLAEGSRVRVHRLRGHDGLGRRVVRIPKDVSKDPVEVIQADLLNMTSLKAFLPDPQPVRVEIEGQVRRVVSSLEIMAPMCRDIPSVGSFAYELGAKTQLDEKLAYLKSLRGFVNACKTTYFQKNILPDLVGRGNTVVQNTGLWLLDFNNIAGDWQLGPKVDVPVDDRGLPIFDMSLRMLYGIEAKLLSSRGANFSTEGFNRTFRQEREVRGTSLPPELEGVLVPSDDLKTDPFYGALRFQARREKVEAILERGNRDFMMGL